MISKLRFKRNSEGGFSLMELLIVMIIIIILVVVVVLLMRGFFGTARETAMDIDLKDMKTAVDAYAIQSGKWPTPNSNLPQSGEYALIDFDADFDSGGKTYIFYPHFISRLPPHSAEGVWRIDSAGLVSIAIDPKDY